MAAPKKPQDHMPRIKTSKDEEKTVRLTSDGRLTFTLNGETWTSTVPLSDALTVGAVRKYRDDEIELLFAMIDGLFADQPEAAAAFDDLPMSQLVAISTSMQHELTAAGEASLGESSSSST